MSRYLDQVFPALGVRVVAIADGYDSAAEKTPADALMLPVKNLFNDMYCRDASAKTKASLSAKRRRGEFVGAFAPYGYAKGSGPDRGRLVIDPEPAGVVRGIFDARIGGMSAAGIASMLNEGLVPSPYEYFAAKGAARSSNFCKGERTELTSGRTDVDYCNEVFGEVFNKPKLWQLLDGIQHETSLTTEDVAEMVTGSKPSLATCYEEIREKLHAVVDRISERRKITNKSIGIDAEPSPGLYGTLYFDLLAEEDAKMGGLRYRPAGGPDLAGGDQEARPRRLQEDERQPAGADDHAQPALRRKPRRR